MLSDRALMESIFETALRGCNVNVAARRDPLWDAGMMLLADVLLNTDPYNRERRLRGLVSELRTSINRLSELLDQPAGKLLHSTEIVSPDDAK
jgi:hypothetical protein